MEAPKISIIIPIYNVEKYLGQCVDSVLNQSYRNLEIILVDDGSPDQCGAICDNYSKTDERIKVIHKENGGLSDARNAGVNVSTGDFVFFLDSDDYLDREAFEQLIRYQRAEDFDLVVGSYWYSYEDYEEIASSSYDHNMSFSNEEAMRALLTGKLQTFAWGKLIKRDLAVKYSFPKGKLFEDHFWTHRIFSDAKKIAYMNEPIVHYRQRNNSISFTYNLKRLDVMEGWMDRYNFIEDKYPEILAEFLQTCSKRYVEIAWLVLTRMEKDKKLAFKRMRSYNQKWHLENYAAGKDRNLIRALNKSDLLYAGLAYSNKIKEKIGL